MKNIIEQIDANTFKLNARGNEMTLKRYRTGWEMYVVNAAVRAWNRGYAIPKYFDTLEEVEAKYKTWSGIVALVGSSNQLADGSGHVASC